MSDSEGRFAIRNVTKWPVVLRSSKSGYIAGSFGQRYAGDAAVPLNETDAREPLTVPLWPGAAVAGRLIDAAGEPIIGVRLQALRLQLVAGRLRFVARGAATSDDRGQYRFSGLVPGSYVVALPPDAKSGGLTSLSLYYPDTYSPDAAIRLELGPGAERLNVDFTLGPAKGFDVRGRLRGLPQGRIATVGVYLQSADGSLASLVVATESANSADPFLFSRLVPGNYVVSVVSFPFVDASPGVARGRQKSDGSGLTGVVPGRGLPLARVSPEPTYWGEQSLAVADRAIENLVVPVTEGSRLRGRVTFEGSGSRPTPDNLLSMPVVIQTADGRDLGSFQLAGLDEDGGFQTVGFPPGRYIPFVFSGLEWFQGSVSVRGVAREADWIEVGSGDVAGIEIRMTSALTTLQGTVRTPDGVPLPRATIYVFPEKESMWRDSGALILRLLECRSASNGRFSRPGIQPGRYYVVADADGAGEMWREPDVLRTLSRRGKAIEFRVGETTTLDLVAQPNRKRGSISERR